MLDLTEAMAALEGADAAVIVTEWPEIVGLDWPGLPETMQRPVVIDGLWALRFLIASLTVTPLRQLLGINLLYYRRQLGLLCFYYACLHLATYLLLDQQLDMGAILAMLLSAWMVEGGLEVVPFAIFSCVTVFVK